MRKNGGWCIVYTFGNDNLQANNCIVPFISVAAWLITACHACHGHGNGSDSSSNNINNNDFSIHKMQGKMNKNIKINEQAYYRNAYCPIVNSHEFQILCMGSIVWLVS